MIVRFKKVYKKIANLNDLKNYISGIRTDDYQGKVFPGELLVDYISIPSGIGLVRVQTMKNGMFQQVSLGEFALVKSYSTTTGNDSVGALCIYIGQQVLGSGTVRNIFRNYLTISEKAIQGRYRWQITPDIDTN